MAGAPAEHEQFEVLGAADDVAEVAAGAELQERRDVFARDGRAAEELLEHLEVGPAAKAHEVIDDFPQHGRHAEIIVRDRVGTGGEGRHGKSVPPAGVRTTPRNPGFSR